MKLEIIYAGIYSWIIIVSIWAIFHIRQFLDQTPDIADEISLDRFKSVARWNMYLALFQMVVFTAGIVTGILLVVFRGFAGLVYVLITNAVVFILGKYLGSLEKKARSLACASHDLEEKHRKISETWLKKALPDF